MASILDAVASLVGHEALSAVGLGGPVMSRAVAAAVLATLVVLLVRVLAGAGRAAAARAGPVLLLGESGSGKTAALMALKQGVFRETYVSLEENDVRIAADGAGGAEKRVVDLPGHASRRYRVPAALDTARAVAFFVDAATPEGKLRPSGEFLHTVLTHRAFAGRGAPVRVVLAKADAARARSVASVEAELLAVLRSKQAVQHTMEDMGDAAERPLPLVSDPDAEFEFAAHPCRVTFGEISAKEKRLGDLAEFVAAA